MTKTERLNTQRQKEEDWWAKRYALMRQMGMNHAQVADYMTAHNPTHWSDKYKILLPHINQIKELTK